MQPMCYTGLDVHKRKISYCVKDSGGKVYAEGSMSATRFDLDRWMTTLPQPWSAATEAMPECYMASTAIPPVPPVVPSPPSGLFRRYTATQAAGRGFRWRRCTKNGRFEITVSETSRDH